MPLFFFLSGLLAARSAGRSVPAFLAGRIRTVAYPAALWSVLQAVALVAFSAEVPDRPDASLLLRLPLHPLMQFWFLYALFAMCVVFAGEVALGFRAAAVAASSLALYALVPLEVVRNEVAAAVAVFFIYFAAGVVLSPRLLADEAPPSRSGASGVGIGLLALGLFAVAIALGLDLTWAARPVTAAFGIAATLIAAARLRPAGPLRFLQAWGRASLPIYVAHVLALIGCRVLLVRAGVLDRVVHIVAGLGVGLGGPLLLAALCQRAGLRHVFVLGRAALEPDLAHTGHSHQARHRR
jgi:fucose 4-O-acetylase-like acetyltransferase